MYENEVLCMRMAKHTIAFRVALAFLKMLNSVLLLLLTILKSRNGISLLSSIVIIKLMNGCIVRILYRILFAIFDNF